MHSAVRVTPFALLAGLAAWVPFGVIAPAYARPPLLTPAEQAAIPQRLDLAVGDQMELLGYRLDRSEVKPGEDLTLALYWRAKAPMDKNYSVFVHLLDQNDMKISQRDVYPGHGSFPTTLWRAGDAIADTYVVHVPANTFRPNRLHLLVGLYSLEGGEPLPVRDRGGRELGSSVRLGDLTVRADPQGGIANPTSFNLENRVALVGYDLDRVSLHAGETLHLTLYWKALAAAPGELVAFAHMLGSDGALWAGKADPVEIPAGGGVYRAAYDLALRPDAPPGDYYVDAGLYQSGSGRRLNVLDGWGHVVDNRAILTRIRVLPAEPGQAGLQPTVPAIEHPLDVTFGSVARLRGYSVSQEVLNPHEPLRVTLYWEALADGATMPSYTVFVHLLDSQNKIVAQHDGAPGYGRWPTTSWARGQVVADEHSLSFADTGYAGQVLVEVGLYDPQTLQRLATAGGDDKVILPVQLAVRP